jgi:transposase-like protein
MGKRKERRRFPKEFKAEAVRQSEREGVTARQVAGEGVDHILSAGEETIVRSKGKAVIVADDHSSVLL